MYLLADSVQVSFCATSLMQLNYDVLCRICDHLDDDGDILAMSQTCRAVRSSAIKRFLSHRPIVLSDSGSIRHFHKLLSADPPARFQHVLGLHVHFLSLPEGDRSELS